MLCASSGAGLGGASRRWWEEEETQWYPDEDGLGGGVPSIGGAASSRHDGIQVFEDDDVAGTQLYTDSLLDASSSWKPRVPSFCPPPAVSPADVSAPGALLASAAGACPGSGGIGMDRLSTEEPAATQLYGGEVDCHMLESPPSTQLVTDYPQASPAIGQAPGQSSSPGSAQPCGETPRTRPRSPGGQAACLESPGNTQPYGGTPGSPARGLLSGGTPQQQGGCQEEAPTAAPAVAPAAAAGSPRADPVSPAGPAETQSYGDERREERWLADRAREARQVDPQPISPTESIHSVSSPELLPKKEPPPCPGGAALNEEPFLADTQWYGDPEPEVACSGSASNQDLPKPIGTQAHSAAAPLSSEDLPKLNAAKTCGAAAAEEAESGSGGRTSLGSTRSGSSSGSGGRSSVGSAWGCEKPAEAAMQDVEAILVETQAYEDFSPACLAPNSAAEGRTEQEPAAVCSAPEPSGSALDATQLYFGEGAPESPIVMPRRPAQGCLGSPHPIDGGAEAAMEATQLYDAGDFSESKLYSPGIGGDCQASGGGKEVLLEATQLYDASDLSESKPCGPGIGGDCQAGNGGKELLLEATQLYDASDFSESKPCSPFTRGDCQAGGGGKEMLLEATQLYDASDFSESKPCSPGIGGDCQAGGGGKEVLLEATQLYDASDFSESKPCSPGIGGNSQAGGGDKEVVLEATQRYEAGDLLLNGALSPGSCNPGRGEKEVQLEAFQPTQLYAGDLFGGVAFGGKKDASLEAREAEAMEATQLYDSLWREPEPGSPGPQGGCEEEHGAKEAADQVESTQLYDGASPVRLAASSPPSTTGEKKSSESKATRMEGTTTLPGCSRPGLSSSEQDKGLQPPHAKRLLEGSTPVTPVAGAVKPIATPARSPMKLGQVLGQPIGGQEGSVPFVGTPLLGLFAQAGARGGAREVPEAIVLTAAAPRPPGESPPRTQAEASQALLCAEQSQVWSWPLTQAEGAAPSEAAPQRKRRRLSGKQTPPEPNPWAGASKEEAAPASMLAPASTESSSLRSGRGRGRPPAAATATTTATNRGRGRPRTRSARGHRAADDDDSDGPAAAAGSAAAALAAGGRGRGGGGRGRPRAAAEGPASPAMPPTPSKPSSRTPSKGPASPAMTPTPSKSSSRTPPKAPRTPCFIATGLALGPKYRRVVEGMLRARLLDEWAPEVTHLVSDTFRRTTKLMCAICAGAKVLVPEYLEACKLAGYFVDEAPFLLKDSVCEAAFARKHGLPSYTLQEALVRAREQGPMLAGWAVYCEPNVPGRLDLRTLVDAAGGTWLKSLGEGPGAERTLHIGKEYDAELLREAACTQVLRFEIYRL